MYTPNGEAKPVELKLTYACSQRLKDDDDAAKDMARRCAANMQYDPDGVRRLLEGRVKGQRPSPQELGFKRPWEKNTMANEPTSENNGPGA